VHRWYKLAAVVAVILGASTLGSGGSAYGQDLVLTTSRGTGYGFHISGTAVSGLYPGATRRIDLTFANPYLTAIEVRSVTGRLVSTSKRGCGPIPVNLQVLPYGGRLPTTVPARSRKSSGHLDVHMPNSVADACQNATFMIELTGVATKVGR
jgi:hypothetical protein